MLELYRMSKEAFSESEAHNNHIKFSNSLLADQYKCTKFPEHALINWFSNDPPPAVTDSNVATGSPAGINPIPSTSTM